MAAGALIPVWRWLITNNGVFSPGALLYTWESGGSTPLPVYQTAALTGGAAHTNPVVADAEGVLPVIYLLPQAYRMEVRDSTGAVIFAAQDDIYDFGQFAAAVGMQVTVLGTLGTTETAGQVVYLSDGSGALTAGRWYLADADLTYASSQAPVIGILLASGVAGDSRLIAMPGSRVTNQSGLAAGTPYYVSATAGALTATAPINARLVGQADSTTSIVLASSPPGSLVSIDNRICDGRLTLTTAVPVTTADVSAATSAFFAPYRGNRLALYDGTFWNLRTFAELTISLVGLTASRPYDVFAYDNATVVTIETLVWTNATTRATALTTQDGVLVKTGAVTRRYLGTIYINASGGQTDDTLLKRYVYNYDNRVPRSLLVLEGTNSWTYNTATFRQANAAAGNQVEVMQGVAESPVSLAITVTALTDNNGVASVVAVGEDSTSVPSTSSLRTGTMAPAANMRYPVQGSLTKVPAVGLHTYVWLEWNAGGANTTFYGDDGGAIIQSGMNGTFSA